MVALAIGLAGLAAAALARETQTARRVGVAAIGAAALAAGAMLLAGSRLPAAGSTPALAQLAAPETSAPADASPVGDAPEHDHDMMMPDAATPVSAARASAHRSCQDGLVVTVTAEPARPGPTDITVDVRDPDGAPLPDARVVVFAEMAGMGQAGQGIPAEEVDAGTLCRPRCLAQHGRRLAGDSAYFAKGPGDPGLPIVLTVSAKG